MKFSGIKILFVFLFLVESWFLLAQTPVKKESNETLAVSAKVNKIKINEDASASSEFLKNYDALVFYVEVKIMNKSNTPLLLLSQQLNYSGIEIAQNLDEFETTKGEFSVYHFATSATFVDDKMWQSNKKILDTQKPDSEKIFILLPNKYIEYEESVRLNLPKVENERYKFSPWKTHSLEELKRLSSIFIRFQHCELLGYGISKKEKERFAFAKKLQNRWEKYGYLWLNEVVSQPIPINLSLAVVKPRGS